jgi:hypothetical protein
MPVEGLGADSALNVIGAAMPKTAADAAPLQQANDFRGAGVDLPTTKIGDPKFPKAMSWTFACVLIALRGTAGDQGVEAVTATNDPLQYDDSSTIDKKLLYIRAK